MSKTRPLGLREIVGGLGLGLLGAGLAMWSVALALTVVGGLLFGMAVVPVLIAPRKGK